MRILLRDISSEFMSRQEFARALCRAFGLLSPGEKREGVVAVVERLFYGGPASSEALASELGFSRQRVLYHLKRLVKAGLVRKSGGLYRMAEWSELEETLRSHFEFLLGQLRRAFREGRRL